jgi:hypothetical protein
MATLRTFICLLAFFLATSAGAQEPSFPGGELAVSRKHGAIVDASDSAAFGQFIRGMRPGDLGDTAQGNVSGYRLVWVVSEHGGMAAVTRGDGSAPAQHDRNTLLISQEFVFPFRTAEDKHGLCVVSDIPCGLICRTTWYYVEE